MSLLSLFAFKNHKPSSKLTGLITMEFDTEKCAHESDLDTVDLEWLFEPSSEYKTQPAIDALASGIPLFYGISAKQSFTSREPCSFCPRIIR